MALWAVKFFTNVLPDISDPLWLLALRVQLSVICTGSV